MVTLKKENWVVDNKTGLIGKVSNVSSDGFDCVVEWNDGNISSRSLDEVELALLEEIVNK